MRGTRAVLRQSFGLLPTRLARSGARLDEKGEGERYVEVIHGGGVIRGGGVPHSGGGVIEFEYYSSTVVVFFLLRHPYTDPCVLCVAAMFRKTAVDYGETDKSR